MSREIILVFVQPGHYLQNESFSSCYSRLYVFEQ